MIDVNFVLRCFEQSKLSFEALSVDGKCGSSIKHLLNNICSLPNHKHLEIGTGSGASIIAASFGNTGTFVTIDCFIHKKNRPDLKKQFKENSEKFKEKCHYQLIENNCYSNFELSHKFDSLFYDGDHHHVYEAIIKYNKFMESPYILIIDDWNNKEIRKGIAAAYKSLRYRILFKREILTDFNDDFVTSAQMDYCWWNGVYISLVTKSKVFL